MSTPHAELAHHVERYANIPIEADHGRLKARLPRCAVSCEKAPPGVVVAGHAFVQNLRRGHYELGVHVSANHRVGAAFAELARAL